MIVDLNVIPAKAHGIRRNGIPEILPQLFAVIKIKLKMSLFSDAEKVVQHFQPGVVIQRTYRASKAGQLTQQVALHLIQTVLCILGIFLVGRDDQILLLFYIADLFGATSDKPVALSAVIVKSIVGAVVQHIPFKGNFVHALADNTKLCPAIRGNIGIDRAHLFQNAQLGFVALHGVIDVGHAPHLAVHIAGPPCAVSIDFINGNRFLYRAREMITSARSARGGIFI